MEKPSTPNKNMWEAYSGEYWKVKSFLEWAKDKHILTCPLVDNEIRALFADYKKVDLKAIEAEQAALDRYWMWKSRNTAPSWQKIAALLKKAGYNHIKSGDWSHQWGFMIQAATEYNPYVRIEVYDGSYDYQKKKDFCAVDELNMITLLLEKQGYEVVAKNAGFSSSHTWLDVRNPEVPMEEIEDVKV